MILAFGIFWSKADHRPISRPQKISSKITVLQFGILKQKIRYFMNKIGPQSVAALKWSGGAQNLWVAETRSKIWKLEGFVERYESV